jgi:hypothetical protein
MGEIFRIYRDFGADDTITLYFIASSTLTGNAP